MEATNRYRDANTQPARLTGQSQDVTGTKQSELALREADLRKDEFLAMLAHELRNPLAPIRNATHVLRNLDLHEPRVRWATDTIERQIHHLTRLVDDLLDVSRIASGNINIRKTPLKLSELIHHAGESVQPLMTAKRHRYEARMYDQDMMLEGDVVRLTQVLENLLDNAAKYTPEGGNIELEARQIGQEVQIQVRDNGLGISADLLPEVFELFRQGDRALDRAQGGLGIGLTLVRRLVELHGGRVEAYSAGPGLGATFSIRLPALAASQAARAGDKQVATMACLRILVVDDDLAVADSMVMLLEVLGHQVRSANSGETALPLVWEFRPDVVLLDIGLPGKDGYEVARLIRQEPGGERLNLISVSGYGQKEAFERSRESGFNLHLVKPVSPDRLCALLADIRVP